MIFMQTLYRSTGVLVLTLIGLFVHAQALRIPTATNLASSIGRRLGATEINITWTLLCPPDRFIVCPSYACR